MKFFQNIKNVLNSLVQDNEEYNFTLSSENASDTQPEDLLKNKKVYPSIDVNLEYISSRYNLLINSDIKIREFLLNAKGKQYKAFLLYIDGLVDASSINDFILTPLMLKNYANQNNSSQIISEAVANNISVRRIKKFNIAEYIYECLIPQNSVEKLDSFDEDRKSVV